MGVRSERHKLGHYANSLSRFSDYRVEHGKPKVPKVVRRLVMKDLEEMADEEGRVTDEDFGRVMVEKLPTMEHDFYDWRAGEREH